MTTQTPNGNWRDNEKGNSTWSIRGVVATVFLDRNGKGWRWVYDDIMSNLFESKEKAKSNFELVLTSSGLWNRRKTHQVEIGKVVSFPNSPNRARYVAPPEYRRNRK